jgi:nucleotide-binding universal stress UspA family protein
MKIVLCFDGSDEAKEGLKLAEAHARAFNGEVVVVTSHVIDDKDYPKRIEPSEKRLQEAKVFLDQNGIPCRTLLSFRGFEDDTGEHLLEIARENKADEIIVGIRSRSRVGKLLLGSVAQFVILEAGCPVVGVKKRGL